MNIGRHAFIFSSSLLLFRLLPPFTFTFPFPFPFTFPFPFPFTFTFTFLFFDIRRPPFFAFLL